MDFTDHGAEQTLQWVLGQNAPVPPATLYVQLHIGDPGSTGIANPALNTERQPITFDTIVSPGIPTDGSADSLSVGTVTWSDLPNTEEYSHVSLWDHPTAGNSWYKTALVSPVTVVAGGIFEIQAANGLLRHQ